MAVAGTGRDRLARGALSGRSSRASRRFRSASRSRSRSSEWMSVAVTGLGSVVSVIAWHLLDGAEQAGDFGWGEVVDGGAQGRVHFDGESGDGRHGEEGVRRHVDPEGLG